MQYITQHYICFYNKLHNEKYLTLARYIIEFLKFTSRQERIFLDTPIGEKRISFSISDLITHVQRVSRTQESIGIRLYNRPGLRGDTQTAEQQVPDTSWSSQPLICSTRSYVTRSRSRAYPLMDDDVPSSAHKYYKPNPDSPPLTPPLPRTVQCLASWHKCVTPRVYALSYTKWTR